MTIAKGKNLFSNTAVRFLAVLNLIVIISALPLKHVIAQENNEETFTLSLNNVDINTLIETVSERTGKNFIIDPRVRATVNVVSSEPVDAEKLYEMFLSVLEVHGFAAVPAGQFIKIVPSSVGAQSAVPFMNEPTDPDDELITRVIRLENIPAPQVVEALRPLLQPSANLGVEATSNTIVVTDRADNIEKLIDLITLMDNP